jgi:uncharacterized membrane protein
MKRSTKALAVILAISISTVLGYALSSLLVNLTVKESITISPASVSLDLYPKQSKWVTFTITNANPDNDTDITLTYTLDGPSPSEIKITITGPNPVTVPASGSIDVRVRIQATHNVTPGSYVLTIFPER